MGGSHHNVSSAAVMRRNNVRITGNGDTTLLFAHGYGCDQNMWRLLTPAFQDRYRLVLFDHVGAGNSDLTAWHQDRYATLAGYARDLLEVIEAVGGPVVFIGHSVSAMIGVLAAIQNPEAFLRLVLIGPSPCYINDGDYVGGFSRADIEGLLETLDSNYLGWASAITPTIMGNPHRPALTEELKQSFCRTDPAIAKHFAHVTFLSDNRKDLASLRTPSLILQCTDDVIAPTCVGEFLQRNTPGSTLRLLRATGHCPHLSEPEETGRAILRYLEEHGL